MFKVHKTRVSHPIAHYARLKQEQGQSASQLFARRFENFADNAHGAVISGSSFSNHYQIGEQFCLDAAALDFIEDQDGVRTTMSLTTADGLGHEDDRNLADSIAKVAGEACAQFNDLISSRQDLTSHTVDFSDLFTQAGEASKAKRNFDPSQNRPHNSLCSLTATTIRYDRDINTWSARFANLGDGMIVVLDGNDYSVKHCIPARTVDIGSDYVSLSVQELSHTSELFRDRAKANIVELQAELEEGDFILQMTDGMYQEFSCYTRHSVETNVYSWEGSEDIEKPKFIDTYLEKEAFERIIQGQNLQAHDIARQLTIAALEKTQKIRGDWLRALQTLSPEFETLNSKSFSTKEEYQKFTVRVWKDLEQQGKSNVSKLLDTFFQSYLDIPALDFVKKMKGKNRFGDCATINVAKVPSYDLELLRALINHPKRHDFILRRLKERNLSEDKLSELVQQLACEKMIPREDALRGVHMDSDKNYYCEVYSETQIKVLKGILILRNFLHQNFGATALRNIISNNLSDERWGLEEYEQLYLALNTSGINEKLNQRSLLSPGIGKRYLGPWNELAKELRGIALIALASKLEQASTSDEKLNLLTLYRDSPLFNDHRHSGLGGGWGRTKARTKIDNWIAENTTSAQSKYSWGR